MSASDVQKLREATGAGIMDCKKALEEAGGDFNKALQIIAEKGILKAEKKGERATGAGLLHSYIHSGRIGVLLDIRCETDFVARTDNFQNLAHELAMHIAAMAPESVEVLMSQEYVRDSKIKIDELIKKTIAVLGENIRVERFCRYEI